MKTSVKTTKPIIYFFAIIAFLFVEFVSVQVNACTNFLITKGASADGSTMITYAADSHALYGELYYTPAAMHLTNTKRDIYEWDTGKYLGQIDQVAETYTVVGNMNEHQVAIGETTWGGRKELKEPNKDDIMDYGSLIYVTLERAKTAREAIKIMTQLVEKYGYYSTGESFSISDPKEVWFMDLVSKGKNHKGAVWVARKVPSGYVSAHANQARIRTFPLRDKKNTIYSKDVITFARDMGFFKGKDKDFSFVDAYSPDAFGKVRFCEARVWAFFNRIAPSLKISPDFVIGKPGVKPMPLWIKPDKKVDVHDVMELMRDHFENTPLDMSKDVGAGAYSLPYRWRPLTWKYKGKTYVNERATSTQQTAFSFVSQSRSWLPNSIGGVLWFGVDDTYMTVYIPMYCNIKQVAKPFAVGTSNFSKFSWSSAFWTFNFVSNYTYSKFSKMIVDVQKVQRKLEGEFLANQSKIEQSALQLYKNSPDASRNYLTRYSKKQALKTVDQWRKLGEFLVWKYLDGNERDSNGKVTHPPYLEHWKKRIVDDNGKFLEKKKLPGEPDDDH